MCVILLLPEQNDVYYFFYKMMFYFYYKMMFYIKHGFTNDRSLVKLRVRQNKCLVTCTLSTNHLIRIHYLIILTNWIVECWCEAIVGHAQLYCKAIWKEIEITISFISVPCYIRILQSIVRLINHNII